MNNDINDIKNIISQLTIEEKFLLLTGKNRWKTAEIERLNIPSIKMSDGPHGLRIVDYDTSSRTPEGKAVCFPTQSAMGATWNPEIIQKVGEALGEECLSTGVDIILGPGTNIKRTPLCGRNFEYFSEDPYLSGCLAVSYIDGVQSKGIGTSLKHFAANNQEFDRKYVSSEVDIRTLRELYLKPFEIAVKNSKPWTVMCAYNRLNGVYCSESKFILDNILRKEWGFQGIVVTDWGADHNRARTLKATLELEMPFNSTSAEVLMKAYDKEEITDDEINSAIERLLNIIFKAYDNRPIQTVVCDMEKHHLLAKEVALEAITLLKNESELLPINKSNVKKIAIIGEFSKDPIIQGIGSSRVESYKIDIPFNQIKELAGDEVEVEFAYGYLSARPTVYELNNAIIAAQESDVAIVFAANRDRVEAESYDRTSLALSYDIEKVIMKVASHNANTVVVIQAGSAIDMSDWIDDVKSVLFAWYGGEAVGSAIADILFGLSNPSGKTAETFPLRIEDTPAYDTYPGNGFVSWYKEGLMVGYRHYDTYNKDVLFPFGHGLSYTSFKYSNLKIAPDVADEQDIVTVNCNVKNTGEVEGKEIIQLYVKDMASSVLRPDKELKAFAKINLKPGEEKAIEFKLTKDAFQYFSTEINDWYVEAGRFQILIGASSRDIRLKSNITITTKGRFT